MAFTGWGISQSKSALSSIRKIVDCECVNREIEAVMDHPPNSYRSSLHIQYADCLTYLPLPLVEKVIEKHLRFALEINPEDVMALLVLSNHYRSTDRLHEFLALRERLASQNPTTETALLSAYVYAIPKMGGEKKRACEKRVGEIRTSLLARLDEDLEQAFGNERRTALDVIEMYSIFKEWDSGVKAAENSRRRWPNDHRGPYHLGLLYEAKNNRARATRYFEEALRLASSDSADAELVEKREIYFWHLRRLCSPVSRRGSVLSFMLIGPYSPFRNLVNFSVSEANK
ncbi:MAG: hypothetical protein ABIJ96_12755 [Elusimicrobiota bacterium]